MYVDEAYVDHHTAQATQAATRSLIQFCIAKIHALQATLLTATDQAEVLETLAQMQSVQLSMSVLIVALASDDANIINSANTLLRSIT